MKLKLGYKAKLVNNKHGVRGVYTALSFSIQFIPKTCLTCKHRPELLVKPSEKCKNRCKIMQKLPTRRGICKLNPKGHLVDLTV